MSRKLSYDTWLFAAALLLVVIGLVMIYSASAIITVQKTGSDNPYYFITRQAAFLFLGSVAMLILMHLDLNRLRDRRLIYGLMAMSLVALVAALFAPSVNGTHRWMSLPHIRLQPSEFAKIIVILFLASFLSRREERINEWISTLLPMSCVLAVFAGAILIEPDFGTAITVVLVAAAMVFAAGIRWNRIAMFVLMLIPAAGLALFSAAYRRDRLLTFLNPAADPQGKGFQAMQSLIAVGTGGLHGLGIGNGRQKLFFLPEPHTDFIFSIVGEELGFIGCLAIIALFAFLVWRGFRITRYSQERFDFYAALGLTLMIGIQALINMSVALCLVPTKGLPLPLVSYGGSSLIASLMAIGLLLNLSQQSG
ncbi:MAG TPA: putative lipid II flippase FtsW [Thermoanaerobaculia bacterium]|nr:putative lipid II flippase FtsW [Thermoanaerobaculia bacterium]